MSDRYRRISHERAKTDEDGFTLIELLIVIVVLGILAAVTVFGLSNISGQSLTSACHADAKSVAVAQEAYKANNQAYASGVPILVGTTNGGPYLRTSPGNTTKYVITTDTTGHVFVNNVKNNPPPAAGVDFENFGATDPCLGL